MCLSIGFVCEGSQNDPIYWARSYFLKRKSLETMVVRNPLIYKESITIDEDNGEKKKGIVREISPLHFNRNKMSFALEQS
jgi:hypothetical protein